MGTAGDLVFYSWQSDLPNACNRGFIEKALEDAAKVLGDDDTIHVEPVIDRDTTGVPGAPDIASTIFGKIEQAQVFVCDVSIINRDTAERPAPNPNILLELGYALKALGPNRIIMVLNDAFGGPELLPFDLRMRRVIRYHMPTTAEDRATERRRLEKILAEGLRAIFAGLNTPPPGETIQSVLLSEQARAAVEGSRPEQSGLARRYMIGLAGEISTLTPKFAEGEQERWDDLLIEAITASQGLVVEFSRLTEAIAMMGASESARAVYTGFTGILGLYSPPLGFSETFHTIDFDFPKFIGHELFTTFFSFLIREERWDLIADLLDDDIYVSNTNAGQPAAVSFDDISQPLELLEHRNKRLQLQRISLHADLLHERHTQGEIAEQVPLLQFVEADYFLFLRSMLHPTEALNWPAWRPWSALYLRHPPRYLVTASRTKYAQQLVLALGVVDIQMLRERFAARASRLRELFRTPFWRDPMSDFDPQSIGSR